MKKTYRLKYRSGTRYDVTADAFLYNQQEGAVAFTKDGTRHRIPGLWSVLCFENNHWSVLEANTTEPLLTVAEHVSYVLEGCFLYTEDGCVRGYVEHAQELFSENEDAQRDFAVISATRYVTEGDQWKGLGRDFVKKYVAYSEGEKVFMADNTYTEPRQYYAVKVLRVLPDLYQSGIHYELKLLERMVRIPAGDIVRASHMFLSKEKPISGNAISGGLEE